MKLSHSNVLLPAHEQRLADSVIAEDVARARGYQSITQKSDLHRLGFSQTQCLTPTLLIPLWNVHGEIALYQHRPELPRLGKNGKPIKYETPRGQRLCLDVHPFLREKVRDPAIPLFITEGIRKADSALSRGLCCLGLLGVEGWRGTNEYGGKTALPDWDSVAFKFQDGAPRRLYMVYDSDVMTKEAVRLALEKIAAYLTHRGASVSFIYLPPGEGGEKTGLDDYLAAGHTTEELLALATTELRAPLLSLEQTGSAVAPCPYQETPHGIVWRKQTREGEVDVPLTNFTARIVADVVEDDGLETRRLFEVTASRGARSSRFDVPVSLFASMNWPTEQLGASAWVYPGLGTKDHARLAVQMLSNEPPVQNVYTHTGWRRLGDAWVYLHAEGGIGAAQDVRVRLPAALSPFMLPSPPTGERLAGVLRASLRLWDLLPQALSVPLLCAIYRAAMGTCDFSLHLAGPSGAFKSELAALAQQHFGAGFDARHLPGSWSSTENALEGLAFDVKDALLVLDDFAPTGPAHDVQRLHSKADRVLRGQGNNAGRLRMRADATLKPPKYPRGLILSTGEDVPVGLSLRARLLVLDIPPNAIDPTRLSVYQKCARRGVFAEAMSGFLAFLAPQYARVQAEMGRDVLRLREQAAASSQHRRTPEIIANLAVGLRWFLQCALAAGTFDAAESERRWKLGWQALGQAAQAQGVGQQSSEPTQRFLELIAAAIASGKAHLSTPEGSVPGTAQAWGWREVMVGGGEHVNFDWRPLGEQIGWIENDDIYLQPDASYNVARRLGADSGDGLTLTARTLHKRLRERGLLRSVEASRQTNTMRKTLSGVRQEVLHLHRSCIHTEDHPDAALPPEPDQTAHSVQRVPPPADARGRNGQFGQILEEAGASGERQS